MDSKSVLDWFATERVAPMTGAVRVAVLGLAATTPDGRGVEPDAARRLQGLGGDIHDKLMVRLERLAEEGFDVDTRGPQDDDPSADPRDQREQSLRERARDVDAQVVVSASLTVETNQVVLHPELYIDQAALPGAVEFGGFHPLDPVSLPGRLDNPVVARAVQEQVLDRLDPVADLTLGLAHAVVGEVEAARPYVESALRAWGDRGGGEVVHLVAGNLAGRQGDWEEAQRQYDLAGGAQGPYPRARLGSAEVAFQRSHHGCGADADTDGLRRAERLYRSVSVAPQALPGAYLREKAAFGIGRVLVCLGQAGAPVRWEEARDELSRVVEGFEAGAQDLQELASEAHAQLALIAMPTAAGGDATPALRDAERHLQRAVELSLVEQRRGMLYGLLGDVYRRLQEPERARAAFDQAAALDPERAADYRRGRDAVGSATGAVGASLAGRRS